MENKDWRIDRERIEGILKNWVYWKKLLGTKHERTQIIPVNGKYYHAVALEKAVNRLSDLQKEVFDRVIAGDAKAETRKIMQERGVQKQAVNDMKQFVLMKIIDDLQDGTWERPKKWTERRKKNKKV